MNVGITPRISYDVKGHCFITMDGKFAEDNKTQRVRFHIEVSLREIKLSLINNYIMLL